MGECIVSIYYVLKLLGLDVCLDTLVGYYMLRGVSGDQRKRVTIGFALSLSRPFSLYIITFSSVNFYTSYYFNTLNVVKHAWLALIPLQSICHFRISRLLDGGLGRNQNAYKMFTIWRYRIIAVWFFRMLICNNTICSYGHSIFFLNCKIEPWAFLLCCPLEYYL